MHALRRVTAQGARPRAAPAHDGLDGLREHLPGGIQVGSQPRGVQLQLAHACAAHRTPSPFENSASCPLLHAAARPDGRVCSRSSECKAVLRVGVRLSALPTQCSAASAGRLPATPHFFRRLHQAENLPGSRSSTAAEWEESAGRRDGAAVPTQVRHAGCH